MPAVRPFTKWFAATSHPENSQSRPAVWGRLWPSDSGTSRFHAM